MLEWVLWIFVACGPGCMDTQIRVYNDKASCLQAQIVSDSVTALCTRRLTI